MHGLRMARHGDPLNPGRLVRSNGRCKVAGCERPHLAKGYCAMHYMRQRTGSLDLADVLTCVQCGVQFARPYRGNPNVIRFCSAECRYERQLSDAKEIHAEKRAIAGREWRLNNPDAVKARITARKARLRGVDVAHVTGKDIIRLVARFDGRCAYCKTGRYEHLDHVVPVALGGRHAIGNLLPACRACNLSKGAKLLAEWRLLAPVPRRFRSRGRRAS